MKRTVTKCDWCKTKFKPIQVEVREVLICKECSKNK